MNSTMNFYELLGVRQNASEEEIRSAYKKQMKKWHPDINKDPNAVNMSSKINEAKEVLLDPIKRKDYDEYLSKKVTETYNRYTQTRKQSSTSTDDNKEEYEDNMMTKWEYLRTWLKHGNTTFIKKIFGTIGVLLESLLCWIIKMILITIAIICNLGSNLIKELFHYLSSILGILGILALIQITTSGLNTFISENKSMFNGVLVIIGLFVTGFALPLFSRLLLSEKVFDILYNKIDINLFKFCVGYKE